MELTALPFSLAAGLLCGIISGFGIGGGSLLMVWMTAAAGLDQRIAQGINLLYFIPTSVGALYFHIKNKMICWDIVIPAAICGCITAVFSAWVANTIDVTLLRKLFGIFLCFIGIKEIFTKSSSHKK
ncbi:MAG: sulfite exporter TauE/SafE family protein [Oscillospiraceae bacterium]|nr:sulfite exporter TauE/SafE family protein [Oscillospiraceae bacterium]